MANVYVSPTGSGDKSGSSADNAMPVASLDAAIVQSGAGGSVLMLADKGAYNLSQPINISHGGTSSAPITIKGVDSAGNEMNIQIFGTRAPDWTAGLAVGNEVFKLQTGANHLIFENMTFNNVATAIRAGADISNIVIQDMYADNVKRFFEDYPSGSNTTATISGLVIRNVEVHGFSENVVRLRDDTHDVLIENVYGDSEGQIGDFAMGVHLDGTVHDVTIRKSIMENARDSGTGYWNGDGFVTERGVYGITFEDTVARGNADGGYDLKSTDTTLTRAIADGNGRNFRIWGETTLIEPVGLSPHKWGGTGGQYQIQLMNGGQATVVGGKFVDGGSATTVVVTEAGTNITFDHTIFIHANQLTSGPNIVGIDQSLVTQITATGISSLYSVYLDSSEVPPPTLVEGSGEIPGVPVPDEKFDAPSSIGFDVSRWPVHDALDFPEILSFLGARHGRLWDDDPPSSGGDVGPSKGNALNLLSQSGLLLFEGRDHATPTANLPTNLGANATGFTTRDLANADGHSATMTDVIGQGFRVVEPVHHGWTSRPDDFGPGMSGSAFDSRPADGVNHWLHSMSWSGDLFGL
jgi:hypothetical protein